MKPNNTETDGNGNTCPLKRGWSFNEQQATQIIIKNTECYTLGCRSFVMRFIAYKWSICAADEHTGLNLDPDMPLPLLLLVFIILYAATRYHGLWLTQFVDGICSIYNCNVKHSL